MVKFEFECFFALRKEDFRVISAVELGQKNHELVSLTMIYHISCLPRGSILTALKNVVRKKLVYHENKKDDGYRLTVKGYDFLAIKTIVNRIAAFSIIKKIESDIFEVENYQGNELVLKMHRLGCAPFRSAKNKREYLLTHIGRSWLYLSRLAALKEFSFMKALYDYGFPVPFAIESNRHGVLMSKVVGIQMAQVPRFIKPDFIYLQCMNLVFRLASIGLVHCDFNEFNLIVCSEELVTIIDFPQMVSTSHPNAKMLFERDVNCINHFLRKNCGASFDDIEKNVRPSFQEVIGTNGSLDSHLPVCYFQKKTLSSINSKNRNFND